MIIMIVSVVFTSASGADESANTGSGPFEISLAGYVYRPDIQKTLDSADNLYTETEDEVFSEEFARFILAAILADTSFVFDTADQCTCTVMDKSGVLSYFIEEDGTITFSDADEESTGRISSDLNEIILTSEENITLYLSRRTK